MAKFKFGDILTSYPQGTIFIFKNYVMRDRIESLEGSNSKYLKNGVMDRLAIVGGVVRKVTRSERKSYLQLFFKSPHRQMAEDKLSQYFLKYKVLE